LRATYHGIRVAVIALTIYWIALTAATHAPVTVLHQVQEITRWNDKLLHFAAFAGLAFLLAWAIPTNPQRRSLNVVVAAFVGVSYAAIDELTQIPVGRTADWADFSADLSGILAGLIVYVAMREILLANSFRLEP
jgi:VanZ family protein